MDNDKNDDCRMSDDDDVLSISDENDLPAVDPQQVLRPSQIIQDNQGNYNEFSALLG